MQARIPKRIIQTGKTAQQALKTRAMVTNLRLLNADFEYLFFDDAAVLRFFDEHYPAYRKVFEAFRFPIQRFDFFRYVAVHHYGGFYFDLDILLADGLTELLDHSCVFPFEALTLSPHLREQGMDWEIGNYAFGAAAGHPFLKAVIDRCIRAQTDPDWVAPMMRGTPPFFKPEFFVLNSTGPGLISRVLAEDPAFAESVTVLFPEDVCDMRSWNQFGSFGVHLMEGSWRSRGGILRRKFAQRWEMRKMKQLVEESGKLGATRRFGHTLSEAGKV